MKFLILTSTVLFILLISLSAKAQEVVGPALYNTLLQVEANQKMLKSRITDAQMKSRQMLELPFIDDFSTDRFPGNEDGNEPLWTSRQATRGFSMPKNPPTLGVVTLDGADEVGFPYQWAVGTGPADTLTSITLDLTGDASDQIGISFYFQPQGFGIFPPSLIGSVADSLRLEFYAPELDQWFWAWSTFDVSNTEAFTFVYLPITQPRYLKDGFRFRFRNFASLQGPYSPWNLDYVRVDRNNINSTPVVDDVAFVRGENTLLQDYTAMPRSHYAELANPLGLMRQTIQVTLGNLSDINRTLVGNEIRILLDGGVMASFSNANSPAISAGATLNYTHSVGQLPNAFAFDGIDGEGPLAYNVEIIHGVADLGATSSNDTIRFTQEFFTNYAYDDGSAESSWANPGTGSEAAMRYTNFKADDIFAIEIFTMPIAINIENTTMTVKIYEDTGNGPGAVIAEAVHAVNYNRDEFQRATIYALDEPVSMPVGSFFVGFQQSNQDEGVYIGLDRNTNSNPGNFWFKGTNLVWSPSQVQGTVMIRPMFTSPGWEDLVLSTDENARLAENEYRIYPNPARDWFTVDLPEGQNAHLRIYDLQGRLMAYEQARAGQRLSAVLLPDGMYIVQVSTDAGALYAKKLLVKR